MDTLQTFAKRREHKELDSCIVCVLTHGDSDELIGVDGRSVSVLKCVSQFNAVNCPDLAGKPKIVILQACRGGELFLFFFYRLPLQFLT